MAFQPIQIHRPMGLETVSNALSEALQLYQQRQRQMADNLRYGEQQKRQQQQDFQQSLKEASAMWKTDPQAALAMMAPFGGQFAERPQDPTKDWAPKLNQNEIDYADTLPMPSAQQQGPNPPAGPVDAISSPTTGSPETLDALMQRAAPPAQQAPTNPYVKAAQADQAKQKQLTQRFLRGNFNGQEWTLDPEAARRQQQEQADDAFYRASGSGTDMADIIREQYPAMRAAAMAAGEPLDPKVMMQNFQADARMRAQERAAADRYQQQLAAEDRRDERFYEHNAVTSGQAMDRTKLIAGTRGAMVEQGEKRIGLSEEAAAREAVNKVFTNLGFRENQVANRKFNDMAAQLSQNPNAAKDAVVAGSFVKLAQGGTGVISDSDMNVFWNRLGGLGVRTLDELQGVIDGRISHPKRELVLQAVRDLAGTAQGHLNEIQKSLEYQFDASPNLSPYKDQMVGTYFMGHRKRVQNRAASGKGGAVDMSVYDEMMKPGGGR